MSSWRPCFGIGVLCLATFAYADDELSRFAERNRLQQQKIQEDVRKALDLSRVLEKSDPASAKLLLERTLAEVKNSDVLTHEPRTQLEKQLQTRVRDIQETARIRRLQEEQDARSAAQRAGVRGNSVPEGANTPANTAQNAINAARANESSRNQVRSQSEKSFRATMEGVGNSSVPIEGDREFAKNWADISQRRLALSKSRMTPEESAILKALSSTLAVNFKNYTFREVINYLSDKSGQPIIVEDSALKEAMVEYDDFVNFKTGKAQLRTVLRAVLADKGLAYVIRDGAIQVVTAQKARNMMVTKTYPLDDFIRPDVTAFTYGGPLAMRAQYQSVAQTIIQIVQSSIEPSQWQVGGGSGSITYFEPTNSLVVRASAETHLMLGGQFNR